MANGGKLKAKVPLIWKKLFSMGVAIPQKMKNCGEYQRNSVCDECDKLVSQSKEFSANLNEMKRQAPNDFGDTLPKYITS